MELSEKIQALRRAHGLTQEQFAELLFVSRTAVSKWETGRGIPNIESLQAIAKLCNITLDELLCAEEALTIAENENRQTLRRFSAGIDSAFNLATVLGTLLPLYKAEQGSLFYSVPLYQFVGWIAVLCWIFSVTITVCGAVQLLATYTDHERLTQTLSTVGLILQAAFLLLLIVCGQPYPAVLVLTLLILKVGAKMTRNVSRR